MILSLAFAIGCWLLLLLLWLPTNSSGFVARFSDRLLVAPAAAVMLLLRLPAVLFSAAASEQKSACTRASCVRFANARYQFAASSAYTVTRSPDQILM